MNNDVHEEVNSTENHEEYTNYLVQNQSVSTISPALLKQYIPAHRTKKQQYDVCTNIITLAGYLSKQVGVKTYQCDACTKTFTQASGCLLYTSRCV